MNQEKLLKIIEEAGRDGRAELNLIGENLTAVPAEIGQLKNLPILCLQANNLTSLPAEIGLLEMPERLYLRGNGP